MADNTQTQQQINALRTLQESYNALAAASSAQATATALEDAKQAILTAIDAIDIDTSDLAKQGTNQNATLSDVQTAAEAAKEAAEALPTLQEMKDAGMIPITIGGAVFAPGVEIEETADVYMQKNHLISIVDNHTSSLTNGNKPYDPAIEVTFNNITFLGQNAYSGSTYLQKLTITSAFTTNSYSQFADCVNLKEAYLPNTRYLAQGFFNRCGSLQYLYVPYYSSGSSVDTFKNCFNLIYLEFGRELSNSLSVSTWDPTNALLSTSNTLVPSEVLDMHPTWMNIDYFLYNMREHIAANLPDRTGLSSLTLTFSAAVKAAINGDTATANAFANKNWIIA